MNLEQDIDTRNGDSAVKRFLKKHRLVVIIAAVVVIIAILLIVIRHRAAADAAFNRRGMNGPIAVDVATATTGDMLVNIPALGTVTPTATVTVRTQINGQLQTIGFKEGQLVHQGDFLAQIDPRPYEATLKLAQANLQRDEALLANARVDLQRYESLLAQDSIAEQQLATQKSLVQQYEGTVEGDRAQVNTAALNLQYTHIVSPVSGRVGLRQVDQGNYVTPGDANGIVVITEVQPITVVFSVPEDNVSSITRRLHTGATLPIDAYDRSNNVKLATGKLISVDNQIDATTGTFKLRGLFDNKDDALFPNQFVNVQLQVDVLHDQVVIPNAAVYHGAPDGVTSAFVYLVKTDNTVTVRPIATGVIDGERIGVTSGLQAGDVVVTAGGDQLREGSTVQLPTQTSAHSAPRAKDHGAQSSKWKHRRQQDGQ